MSRAFCPLKAKNDEGFSLLELSVVIVIIAVVTGGVVAGKSLFDSANLRSVATKAQAYIASINNFTTKYQALPGDFANATDVWGSLAGCPTAATGNGQLLTCNGNGDGKIGQGTQNYEIYRAWQQLASAGMIEGHYTGIGSDGSGVSSWSSQPGVNVPNGPLDGTGYTLDYYNASAYVAATFRYIAPTSTENRFHTLLFGLSRQAHGDGAGPTDMPVLTPAQAGTLDRKFDDGLPNSGAVMTYNPATSWAGCVVFNAGSDPVYATADSAVPASKTTSCNLAFRVEPQ